LTAQGAHPDDPVTDLVTKRRDQAREAERVGDLTGDRGSRLRRGLGWLPAVIVAPAILAAAVGAARTEDPAEAMSVWTPLDPGTTWVYAVEDHGEDSGRRTRQILGPSRLVVGEDLVDMVRVSSVYDAYPGQGYQSVDSYLEVSGDELLQHGLLANGRTFDIDPPAPAYVLPREEGATWDYDGLVGDNPYRSTSELTEIGAVEVRGETFEDCAKTVTEVDVLDAEGEKTGLEVQTEWSCPDIGTVLLHTVNESDDVDITEELVRFRSPGRALDLGELPEPADGTAPEVDEGDLTTTAGFDVRRSFAIPGGTLGRELAWTDVRDLGAVMPMVSDGRTTVLGEQDGMVTARDEATGELRWQVGLTPPIVATPAIQDDVVLVADASKALWALSLTDGTAQWVHTFDDVVGAAPTVADGVVAVPVDDATVVALDLDDGAVVWTTRLGGRVLRPPAADGDTLVVADSGGALTALDLDDGDEVWSAGLAQGVDMGPAIGGGRVVVSDMEGVVSAYGLDDGTLYWQKRGRSFSTQSFAVTDDQVVMVADNDGVESFDLADGDRLWATRLEDLETEPVIVGDEVLAMSEDGDATVLDLADGDVVDSWRLPRPSGAEIVIDGAPARTSGAVVYRAQVSSVGIGYTYYAYPVTADAPPRGITYDVDVYAMPSVPDVPPVLDGDTLYALTFDKLVLRSESQAEVEPVTVVEGPTVGLAASDGVVVVPSGTATVGVDGRTGEQLWSLDTGEVIVGSVPATDGKTVFIPIHEVGLVAADLHTGEGRWVVPALGTAGSSIPLPLPGGDVLYAASGLARYDGASGDVVWQLGGDLEDAVAYTPISADGDVVFAALVTPDPTSANGERTRLVAADVRSGRVLWQHEVVGGQFGIGPAAADGVVVVTDGSNLVTGYDGRSGEELWSFRMATQAAGAPVLVDGVVHLVERGRAEDIAARNFRVVTLDARTGLFVGSYEPPGTNDVVRPTVGAAPDGRLLVPTVDFIGGTVEVLEVVR
jgi:outer membrane protein assembly factor BamB